MSVAGKARHFPTSLELIYANKRETTVLHALIRDAVSKPGTASSRPIGSAFAVPGSLGNTNVFTEPIALNPKAFIITSDAPDTIRIDKTFGKYSSRIIVNGEGGAADNITTIIGKDDGEGNTGKAAFAGQILNIEAVLTTPLTLIDGADIATPGGASFLIRGGSNVTLIYDSTLDKWKFLHDALVQRLTDLLDVTIGGDPLATGHHLEFTGTVWENKEDITFVSGGANILNIQTLNWIGGHQLTRGATAPHLDLVMSGDTTFRVTLNSNIMFEVSDLAALGLKMSQPIYMQNENLYFDSPPGTRSIKFDGTSSLDYKVPAANFHRFFAGVSQRFGVNDDQVIVDTVPLRLPEIATPSPNPAANSGFIYGKVIGGTHAEPHWLDELGTETNLLAGAGVTDKIEEGDSRVEVVDTGTGSIEFYIDDSVTAKANIFASGFNFTSLDIFMFTNKISFDNVSRFIDFFATDNGIRVAHLTGEQFNLEFAGGLEYDFNETEFDLHANDMVRMGNTIRFNATTGAGIFWTIGTPPNETQIFASTTNLRIRTGSISDEILLTLATTDMIDINANEIRFIDTALEMDLDEEIRWSPSPGGTPRIRGVTGGDIEYEVALADQHSFLAGASNMQFNIRERVVELFGNFASGLELSMFRDDATPADNDILGILVFHGRDSLNNKIAYAEMEVQIVDFTSTTKDSRIRFRLFSDNNFTDALTLEGGGTSTIPKIGFRGAAAQPVQNYTITNPTTDRSLNVTADNLTQVAQVLGTVIQDFIDMGMFV